MSVLTLLGSAGTSRSVVTGALGLLAVSVTACGAASEAATPAVPTSPAPASTGAPKAPLPRDVVARAARPLYALIGSERVEAPALWEKMSAERAICFGEQHDSAEHHFAQNEALTQLAKRAKEAKRRLAVGFEMFQRPYQPALSGFVGGDLDEERFLTESEYKTRWGFDFSLYRPLLETARQYELEALALNTPRELTRKVSRQGLGALEPADREQLPELDLNNADHRAYFDAAMQGHTMPPGGPKMDDMYAAQVVWDETMADTAARWLAAAEPNSQVIVFAGNGHCHESAIPARITRRSGVPALSVSPVLASELDKFEARSRYDWLIVLEDG